MSSAVSLLVVVAALAVAAPVASGQLPASEQGRGAVVEAVVHDSLSGDKLAGATVQLVSATDPVAFSRTGETDSLGRVAFRDIPHGRYSVGFMHPLLDAIGVAAPLREVRVDSDRAQRVELAIPSATRLRAAVCGLRAAADSSVLVLGTVRDPRDQMPIWEASVSARWMEISFGIGNITQRANGITATTGPNGWFALCGVPSGTVMFTARRGSDSTHTIELQLEASSLVRRDLYVAAEGRGRLHGRIVKADSARPLAGVRVSLVDGPVTTTDAAGSWTIENVPLGTRMVEFRAIGHYPERRAVDVVADAQPLEVALQTFEAVLEAVRVTATRLTGAAAAGGFAERRRGSGMGRFMDSTAIARRNPIFTSDLLKTMPGFIGDGSLTMKGNFSDGGGNFDVNCTAEVYVDGQFMRGISADELDVIVSPENIVGIEVYNAGSPKPAQFDSGMSGCGALVIWQKPMNERVRRRR